MNGPSAGFLSNVWAPFAAGEQLAGVGPVSPTPVLSVAGQQPAPPPLLSVSQPPAPPPNGPSVPPPMPDPHADETRQMSVMGPNASAAPPPSAPPSGPPPTMAGPPPPPAPTGLEYPLRPVGGPGMSKAREVERRGPSLLAAQEGRNLASEQTIQRVGKRNAEMADMEYQVELDAERQAVARQAAAEQAAAERQQEMDQRLADFDSTTKQLGQMGTINPDRLMASKTTWQKIAGFVELAASGFRGAPSMVMKQIDDDVKAQEFAYYAARDQAQAKQTAFSLAMQKWNNADAARAAARASAIDVTQAQLAQISAKWKGTESANRADMALAALQDEKMMQIQNGIQFVPSMPTGRRWVDPRTGLVYSEQEAKAIQAKLDERAEARQMEGAKVGGQLLVEGAKGQADLDKLAAEQRMTGGLGKTGAEKMALEEAKSAQERHALVRSIQGAEGNVDDIVRGGPLGAAASKALPGWLPGVSDAIKNANARDAYNVQAMMGVAAAYKLSTDATEPKNLKILEHYSAPYVIGANDPKDVALDKMRLLKKLVNEGAAARGGGPPQMSKEAAADLKTYGGK